MFTSDEVCELTGVTYRQLDCWTTAGVVIPTVPARGSGSRRRFTEDDVRLVALALRLAELGCPLRTVSGAVAMMAGRPPTQWDSSLVVYPDGDALLGEQRVAGAAWVVDLPACRDVVGDFALTALAG